MTIDKRNFNRKIIKQINIGYQLFLPMEYDAIADKKWPLILFLHGIKKRGEDLSTLDGYGLTAIAESSEYFDFIVVTPQCSSYSNWPT
jgi:predicted peptidase